ncbi:MAG: amidohydrolase [Bacteroidales bacterium]|nr:amidohydrolase [Bacteroidales bacterium]
MQNILALRQQLHENAELSGKEVKTNAILNEFLEKLNPDVHIRNIGGNGIAVVFKGKDKGRRILVRGDIDALNIPEGDRHCSHRCGHDGHASIIAGLAEKLSKNRPEKGEIVLLFQPAEETGQGAKAVIADPQFEQIKPDMAFALHNIPGYPKNKILLRKGCFAAGSLGLKLIFDGVTAHASQPETGHSPQHVLSALIDIFGKKAAMLQEEKPLTMMTMTHAVLGEETFGVAPAHAEIWLTLRSFDNEKLQHLTADVVQLCAMVAEKQDFEFGSSIHEAFSATMNNDEAVQIIENAAKSLNIDCQYLEEPFRWSEDFGRFADVCPIGMFGLGCGEEHLPLHNPEYVFEDDIIETGIDIMHVISTGA